MSLQTTAAVTLLRLRGTAKVLDAHWEDGATAQLPYRLLRERCPCAECRQRRRAAGAFQAAADIDLLTAVPAGPNAVNLQFSDGHRRGIYPFAFLRELRDENVQPRA